MAPVRERGRMRRLRAGVAGVGLAAGMALGGGALHATTGFAASAPLTEDHGLLPISLKGVVDILHDLTAGLGHGDQGGSALPLQAPAVTSTSTATVSSSSTETPAPPPSGDNDGDNSGTEQEPDGDSDDSSGTTEQEPDGDSDETPPPPPVCHADEEDLLDFVGDLVSALLGHSEPECR